MKNKRAAGFSMLEVLVFVTILNLVFIAAISLVVSSLYRTRINLHKAKALFYAEELKEWLSGEREVNWAGLQSRVGTTYCVNTTLDLDATFSDFTTGQCNFNGIGTDNPRIFRRRLILSQSSPAQISARIEVSWNEVAPNGTNQQYDEVIQTIFTAW